MTEPPAPPPPPLPPPPPMIQVMPGRTDGLAIASLVLGILSIPGGAFYGVFGIIFGPIAIVLGLVARGRIKQSGGMVGGGGLATAGWITGICGLGIGVVEVGLFIALIVAFQQTSTTR